MDILKRSLAPITEEAWKEIDDTAREMLPALLSARKVVDVEGPKGLDFPAVTLGRLDLTEKEPIGGVKSGVHTVQPLVESRVSFELNIWELDNIIRGAKDINLDPLEDAVKKMAKFEENVIYAGFEPGRIKGFDSADTYSPLTFKDDPKDILEAIGDGITDFMKASVGGPYALVVGPEVWKLISSYTRGYPLPRQIERLIDGQIILSPFLEGAYFTSLRGGDLVLTLGQDFSIGYLSHNDGNVKLFVTESFTFQIVDPASVRKIELKK